MGLQSITGTSFRDFDLNFISHPLTGDVPVKVNAESIKQALLTLFYLDKYDVPFDMDAYSNIRQYLFEPNDSMAALNIQNRTDWLIKKYETRIQVYSITVTARDDDAGYIIYVVYRIKDLNVEDSVKYTFTRIR